MASARKQISRRMRFEIFKRDSFTCQYCGGTPPSKILEVDHVVPVSKGGKDERHNLVTSCFECNRGKADIPLTQIPIPILDELNKAVEIREQTEAFERFLKKQRKANDKAVAEIGSHWLSQCSKTPDYAVLEKDRARSLRIFLAHFPAQKLMHFVDVAHSRKPTSWSQDGDTWKYFCGICWKEIKEAKS